MGLYDARCMITGVSLKGSQAALVLLQQVEAAYQPIALAITGQYDRLGSIDMIDEDENTEIILQYFLDQLAANTFVADAEYLRSHEAYPIETTEQLLRGFERNMNDHSEGAVLHGKPVVYALIAAAVWDAIAKSAKPPSRDDRAAIWELFGGGPVAREIYSTFLADDLSGHIRAFAGVSTFLTARGIPWTPPDDFSQHYCDEMMQYFEQARATFHDSPAVLKGLQAYRREIADLLED
jgi:hypothetical protein